MRVGITCYPVYGGSGVVATELGLQLAKRGHEIHFITYAQPFRLPYFVERVYYHEVEIPAYPLFDYPPYSLALAVAMHAAAVQHRLDLLHVHYAIPHATSAWIAREMLEGQPLKVLTTLHGTDITLVGRDPSFRTITRFSLERSDGVTAVSEYLRRQTIEHFELEAASIRTVPNFVDLETYNRERQPCHRAQFAEPGERILMHISNFRPVKRVSDTVAILARLVERMPARLLLVGDGPERGRVQAMAAKHGLADRVLFLGKQESVAELLSCADLFLLPSESEAFGLVALEAMACGVPVVATNVGGLPEVVPPDAGALLPVGDVDAMASAALELLDPDRWARAGEAARVAAERFSAERVIPMYEDVYREVLAS